MHKLFLLTVIVIIKIRYIKRLGPCTLAVIMTFHRSWSLAAIISYNTSIRFTFSHHPSFLQVFLESFQFLPDTLASLFSSYICVAEKSYLSFCVLSEDIYINKYIHTYIGFYRIGKGKKNQIFCCSLFMLVPSLPFPQSSTFSSLQDNHFLPYRVPALQLGKLAFPLWPDLYLQVQYLYFFLFWIISPFSPCTHSDSFRKFHLPLNSYLSCECFSSFMLSSMIKVLV